VQSRPFAILGTIASLTFPSLLCAQGNSGIQLFTAYDNSYPDGGLGTGGVGLTLGNSRVALRGSYAVSLATINSLSSNSSLSADPNSGRWAGDLDIIFADNFFGLGGLLPGLHPYGLAGIGAHSIASAPTLSAAVKTWSYGGGISFALTPTFAINGEMRTRSALGSGYSTDDFTPGMEFRGGITLSFGGGSRSSRFSGGGGSVFGGSSSGISWPAGNSNASGAARRVIPAGERYVGVPYVWGGSTPQGFDCSGFVQYVYRQEGVDLPRTSRQMAGSGFQVNQKDMAIGDLILFAETGEAISHVALYAGNGRILHSTASGGAVRYDDLSSARGAWFATHIVEIRRVATGSAAVAASFAKSTIPFDHFDPPDKAPPVKGGR
jgi:cell wall-associated NlpC family hydrolase